MVLKKNGQDWKPQYLPGLKRHWNLAAYTQPQLDTREKSLKHTVRVSILPVAYSTDRNGDKLTYVFDIQQAGVR